MTAETQHVSTLQTLLIRNDKVAIKNGRLVIQPISGKPVPKYWLEKRYKLFCMEILKSRGMDAFEYVSYSTGNYAVPTKSGKALKPGVTLQFVSVLTGQTVHAIFNANLKRDRNTRTGKAGSDLPKGQFRVGTRHLFYRFWLSAGLTLPKRLSSFHDYMGNLKGRLFIGTQTAGKANRIEAGSLATLNISNNELATLLLPDRNQTLPGQLPDNSQTKVPDKELAESQQIQELQPDSSGCDSNWGNKLIGKRGYEDATYSPTSNKTPPDLQTIDEWLSDYENTDSCYH